MKKNILFAAITIILSMCGCSEWTTVSSNKEEFAVNDTIVKPAENIRETHYNCEEIDCQISAATILLAAYGNNIYPFGIAQDKTAEELLGYYGEVHHLTSWEEVVNNLNNGTPVLFKDYHPILSVQNSKIMEEDFKNSHWVVLYDIDEDVVHISDPMSGFTTSEIKTMQNIWEKCGEQAMILIE